MSHIHSTFIVTSSMPVTSRVPGEMMNGITGITRHVMEG